MTANTVGWPSTVRARLTLPALAGAVKVIVSPLMLAVPALADTDFVREAERMGLPLAPRIGADFRNDIATLETDLRGLWQRRPWQES